MYVIYKFLFLLYSIQSRIIKFIVKKIDSQGLKLFLRSITFII